MKKILIIIFTTLYSLSYSQEFEKVDKFIDSLKLTNDLSIDSLAILLTKDFENENEKVCAIFNWISKNIKYDYVGLQSGYWHNLDTKQEQIFETYNQRKGICEGFAGVFGFMLDMIGVENQIISGYSRVDLGTIFLSEPNHDWNAIKVNGKWGLYDVTWSFNKNTNEVEYYYFNSEPEWFAYSHFPIDKNWLLFEADFSLNEFLKFPIYSRLFHMIGFGEMSKKGFYKNNGDSIKIELRPKKNFQILGKIYDFEKSEWFPIDISDYAFSKGYIKIKPIIAGDGVLKITAFISDENGMALYPDLVYFLIEKEIN